MNAGFYVLPELCTAKIISLTTPPDACRLSLISSTFQSIADSDVVWECFLPSDYGSIISESSSSSVLFCSSKKQLFLTLCNNPLLIHGGTKSFSLDKWSGKKCYMIAARELLIVWGDTPRYWRWFYTPEARFSEVAWLINVCWLEIHGKINTALLSASTVYAAYLVFQWATGAYGFEHHPVEVNVGVIGEREDSNREVYLDCDPQMNQRSQIVLPRFLEVFTHSHSHIPCQISAFKDSSPHKIEDGPQPREREDGWFEIEIGEFYNEGGEHGELEMTVMDVKNGKWKGGLIVQGIEIRPKLLR